MCQENGFFMPPKGCGPHYLISYAGLAPGHRQSETPGTTVRSAAGQTDRHLRYLLIESMQWVCQVLRCRQGRRVRFFTAAALVTLLEEVQKEYPLRHSSR